MRRDFYILWVDDEFAKGSYSLSDLVKEIKDYVVDCGFIPDVKEVNNFHEAMEYLDSKPKIDMFICDYNIGEIKGTDLFKDIRLKHKQDLILYSNISKEQIKQELITFLNQHISPEFFSRFTFTSLTDTDSTIEVIQKLIYLNIMKWQEINGLRGMVLAEVSQIHHDLICKIQNSSTIRHHIATVYNSNIAIDSGLSHGYINSYICGNSLNEKIDFSVICNMLIPLNSSLFQQYKSIAAMRNSLAHVSEEYDDKNGYFLRSLRDPNYFIYEKDITERRKEVLKFEDDLYAYLRTINL